MPLSSNEILSTLRSNKELLRTKYGVIEIGLFGSYANGTSNESSDIDFIVSLETPSFKNFVGLQFFLEDTFKKKIEIIRKSKNVDSIFLRKIKDKIKYV